MAEGRFIPMSRAELRDLFNLRYLQRFHNGEFSFRVVETGPPDPDTDFPPGTKSQRATLRNKETGQMVALVHWFRLPTGSLGASGDPDPIRVYYEGVVYYYVLDDDNE
jgi:hypothetical protein